MFLKVLAENNNVKRMHRNKDVYQQERKNFTAFIQKVIDRLKEIDPLLEWLQAKDCMFRQNKDIRFSTDKTPYKTNFGGVIAYQGKKSPFAGIYIHIEPWKCFIGGWMYMTPSPVRNQVRAHIALHYKELDRILATKKFAETFHKILWETVKTAPKWYAKDHPAIKYLRYKYMYVSHPLKDSFVLSEGFVDYIVTCYKALKPFQDFMNKALHTS